MSNGSEACCAAGVCCPPAQRQEALAKILVDEGGCHHPDAHRIAGVLLDKFVLAPKSLEPFVTEIVAMVKAHPHVEGV